MILYVFHAWSHPLQPLPKEHFKICTTENHTLPLFVNLKIFCHNQSSPSVSNTGDLGWSCLGLRALAPENNTRIPKQSPRALKAGPGFRGFFEVRRLCKLPWRWEKSPNIRNKAWQIYQIWSYQVWHSMTLQKNVSDTWERGKGKPAPIMKTHAHSKLPACKTFNVEILQL